MCNHFKGNRFRQVLDHKDYDLDICRDCGKIVGKLKKENENSSVKN